MRRIAWIGRKRRSEDWKVAANWQRAAEEAKAEATYWRERAEKYERMTTEAYADNAHNLRRAQRAERIANRDDATKGSRHEPNQH
jgi:hypothetical protein